MTDGKNLIVVLTRACSITSSVNPTEVRQIIKKKKRVIADRIKREVGLSVPILHLENEPPARLAREKDWIVLPDGVRQPKNLFEAIQKEVLGPSGNAIGKLAIREFFAREQNTKVKHVDSRVYKASSRKEKLTEKQKEFLKQLKNMQKFDEDSSGSDSESESDTEALQKTPKEETMVLSKEEKVVKRAPINLGNIGDLLGGYELSRKELKRAQIFDNSKTNNMTSAFSREDTFQIATSLRNNAVIDSLEMKFSISQVSLNKESIPIDRNCFNKNFIDSLTKLQRPYNRIKVVKNLYDNFFKKYGHGLILSADVGGEVTIAFVRNGQHPQLQSPQTKQTPTQLKDILERFGIKQDHIPENIQMFYADEKLSQVQDSGNKTEISFSGGNEKFHQYENVTQWIESLYDKPEIVVSKSNVLMFHDLVKKLDWLPNNEIIARNLEHAQNDMLGDGRREVAEKDEKADIGMIRGMMRNLKKSWFG